MKYPKYLEKKIDDIKAIIQTWPLEKTIDEIMSWILQFDSVDYDLAIRVIKNMNVIGQDNLNMALGVAYSKLLRHAKERGEKISNENTLYLPIGSEGKSGAMIAYIFRTINGLSSTYFLSSETLALVKTGKIRNLVLLDDIIATGDQSSDELKDIADKARSLGIPNVYLMTAIGFSKGIERLRETEVADVFSAVEYDESDTVMSLDSVFYEGLPYEKRRQYFESISKQYGGYGYGVTGALITFFYNTPNCSVKMIWGSKDGWIPLFDRKFDMKTNPPEFYTKEEFVKTKEEVDEDVIKKEDCTIYVEGKTEELLIQEVAAKYNNFGYETLSVISIGPFVSASLVSSLKKYSHHVFFVTDDDLEHENGHVKSIKEATKDSNLICIGDTMSYFDTQKIIQHERFSKVLGKDFNLDSLTGKQLYAYLENRLFKHAPASFRVENMRELIKDCAIDEKIQSMLEIFKKEDSEI